MRVKNNKNMKLKEMRKTMECSCTYLAYVNWKKDYMRVFASVSIKLKYFIKDFIKKKV